MSDSDRAETAEPGQGAWREPTVRQAFVDGFSGGVHRDRNTARNIIVTILVLMALALLIPSIRYSERIPTFVPILGVALVFQVYKAADLQSRLGRPASRSAAAVLGVLVAGAMVLVPSGIVSWVLGPRVADAPLTAVVEVIVSRIGILPFVVLFFGSLAILALVIDRRYVRPRRRHRAMELDAAIVRELAARARSHELSVKSS